MEENVLDHHGPGALPTRGKADVAEPQHPVAAYPNARLPDNHAYHVPRYSIPLSWSAHYGVPIPWGVPYGVPVPWAAQYNIPVPRSAQSGFSNPQNSFVSLGSDSVLSGSSPSGQQKRNASSCDPTPSAAEGTRNCIVPGHRRNDNVQGSMRPGHHFVHYGARFGPAMAYPDAQLPAADAPYIPQHGYPTSWGGLNGFVYPDPTDVPYGPSSRPQKESYEIASSAANDKKNSGYGVPMQRRNNTIQDSMPPGHHLTHYDAQSGPTMIHPNAPPHGTDAHHVPQSHYLATWSDRPNGFSNPEPNGTPSRFSARRMQENSSSYDPAHTTSGNKKGLGPGATVSSPRDTISPQGYSKFDNPRSAAGSRTATTGSWQSPAGRELKKNSVNVPSSQINVVIFGETGVGKSSLINLIADEKRAHTSNSALGCTFEHERHDITVGGVACTFWDTAGLDEGSKGTVPADVAENNLKVLLGELVHTGIHLIIYCIRAARLTKALKRNYDLFYVGVCQKKVSVALVVTGLEYHEGEMETWWYANEDTLLRSGMRFDAHACVTTLDSEDQTIESRRSESRRRLHGLVLECSRLPPWKVTQVFPSSVFSASRDGFRENLSVGVPGNMKTVRKVIICDVTTSPQILIHVSRGITASCQRFNGTINGKQYEFVRVDKHTLETTFQHEEAIGVLVFYTSALVDGEIPQEDIAVLKKFYITATGRICPVIVVLGGCNNEETARRLGGGVTLHDGDIHEDLVFLPNTEDDRSNKLHEMIESLCIEHLGLEVIEFGEAGWEIFQAVEVQISHVAELVKRAGVCLLHPIARCWRGGDGRER